MGDLAARSPRTSAGTMRTYTIRDARAASGADTRLVVDFVVHGHGDASGPGGDWGAHAAVGRPGDHDGAAARGPFGGIEFDPGTATRLLLVGDETAVPAIARHPRATCPPTARGAAFLEVPTADDVLDRAAPGGHRRPLAAPRRRAARRRRCTPPCSSTSATEPPRAGRRTRSTPTCGRRRRTPRRARTSTRRCAWSATTTTTSTPGSPASPRSSPACAGRWSSDLGIDRHQVAFMGYWRDGVAMRS